MKNAWNGTSNLGCVQPAKALDALGKALALEPQFVEAWIDSGIALLQLGRNAEAIENLNRALAIGAAS